MLFILPRFDFIFKFMTHTIGLMPFVVGSANVTCFFKPFYT
ncbi:hypothetical protein PMAN_b0204 [Pseudoalteromonas marina]|nr:hypothetical protein PMAN_b0204 [Pseudoalteromonas marina]